MTDFNTPEPNGKDPENICPKLDNYKPLIDEWLAEDRKASCVCLRNFISEFSHDRIVLISTHIVSDIEYISTRNAMIIEMEL